MTELSYALRNLWRAPAFSIVAVVTLAIGIGANIPVFALIEAVLLRPLARFAPDRLVRLAVVHNERSNSPAFAFSYPDYKDIRGVTQTITDVTAAGITTVLLRIGERTSQTLSEVVSDRVLWDARDRSECWSPAGRARRSSGRATRGGHQ